MRHALLAATLAFSVSGSVNADEINAHLASCAFARDKSDCEAEKAIFGSNFPKAYQGDYQAQRNVAYCLRDGCNGAVQRNPSLSCAWRLVIVASGSPRVDATDQSNLRLACGSLDALGFETAKLQAARLGRQIEAR